MPSDLDAYDFPLPPHLIAQHPLHPRDASRMLVLRRGRDGVAHFAFTDLPALLPPRSVLVFNNTRVLPARLTCTLPGGAPAQALLVRQAAPGRWEAMVKHARRLKPGQVLDFAQGRLPARCLERTAEGHWLLEFLEPPSLESGSPEAHGSAAGGSGCASLDAATLSQRLEAYGLAPLPPYIRREDPAQEREADRAAYQTVYASQPGAIAAPTAGLHFTADTLRALDAAGHTRLEVTLHVGAGTFAPVKAQRLEQHHMHQEQWSIQPAVARQLVQARQEGRAVIAIGTTTVRTLESWALQGNPEGAEGTTELFIRPPFQFQATDGILTNFHLPRSTLLLLVSAFHGRERTLAAYRVAVREEYRFFSFGDCMLLLPGADQGHPASP